MFLSLLIFATLVFFLYPLIHTLRNENFEGWSKFQVFLIVLFTSWIGWFWIWAQTKPKDTN